MAKYYAIKTESEVVICTQKHYTDFYEGYHGNDVILKGDNKTQLIKLAKAQAEFHELKFRNYNIF
jgi:hypothetical protein